MKGSPLVKAESPGLEVQEIEVSISRDVLTIDCEKTKKEEERQGTDMTTRRQMK